MMPSKNPLCMQPITHGHHCHKPEGHDGLLNKDGSRRDGKPTTEADRLKHAHACNCHGMPGTFDVGRAA